VSQFEKLRGSYRTRREFSAFKVTGASAKANEILKNLGIITG
ncbi:MAG: DUF3410 domain-containing protein, partial [Lentisphaeria bacterium]|nr:DUF3410 domain-containing protein [Lentisphaeria bacterium]